MIGDGGGTAVPTGVVVLDPYFTGYDFDEVYLYRSGMQRLVRGRGCGRARRNPHGGAARRRCYALNFRGCGIVQ
jgi:hypothetical protein